MAAKQFTAAEWDKINAELDRDPAAYGLPERVYGSIVVGSFNIRKLGRLGARNAATWSFLARVCKQFDLLAIQEVQDDLSGLKELMRLMGDEFGMIVSDATGALPGSGRGMKERLAFVFNWRMVSRTEVATDVSYDRTSLLDTLTNHHDEIEKAMGPYLKKLAKWREQTREFEAGERDQRPKKPKLKIKLPRFLTFARTPFCVSFEVRGHPDTEPYRFMAINAHLYFGDYMTDRRQEFDALMEWILGRVREHDTAYYENFVLLGDLNLDFNDPDIDRERVESHIKTFNRESGAAKVNFPLITKHPIRKEYLRTNARDSETFDHIGLFIRDPRFPDHNFNERMGLRPEGPDYGVFELADLFSVALKGKRAAELGKQARDNLIARFEHKVSDHKPLWLRMPLPARQIQA